MANASVRGFVEGKFCIASLGWILAIQLETIEGKVFIGDEIQADAVSLPGVRLFVLGMNVPRMPDRPLKFDVLVGNVADDVVDALAGQWISFVHKEGDK